MVKHFYISNYDIIQTNPNTWAILVKGRPGYYDILRNAYRQKFNFSKRWSDRNKRFDWGTYIYNVDENTLQEIDKFLQLLCKSIYLHDALDQTFALDHHMKSHYEGGGRTVIGEQVYKAKPYNSPVKPVNRKYATELTLEYEKFIHCHPAYKNADWIVSIPYYGNKDFDLPTFIVEQLSHRLEITNASSFVKKIRQTKSMKDMETVKEKTENILGAFAVSDEVEFQNKVIIVIDDLYHSGATLHEFGTTLQRKGAIVRGLVATKTRRD